MQKAEKRKKDRIASIHLMNYVSLDQNYQEVGQGMGRTINMSETGLLIETHNAINPEHFLSLNIGLADKNFKVHGQVIYSTNTSGRIYHTGIRFNQASKDGYSVYRNILAGLHDKISISSVLAEESNFTGSIPIIRGPECDLLYVTDEETYLPGEKIVSQGNFGNWVWVVLDGWATVVRETQQGNHEIFKIGPGAFIGSPMSFLTLNHARTNSVIASETIQLGLLDTHRMNTEYGALSPEFRDILISLSGQLKRIIDRIAEMKQGEFSFKEERCSDRLILAPGQEDIGLHAILRGKATVLNSSLNGEFPLINLFPGDFVGTLPFEKDLSKQQFNIIRASRGFEKRELSRPNLIEEYHALPQVIKNMIKFKSLKIIAGSQMLDQLNARSLQIN